MDEEDLECQHKHCFPEDVELILLRQPVLLLIATDERHISTGVDGAIELEVLCLQLRKVVLSVKVQVLIQ